MKTSIEFEHGETTCAVTIGNFCRFMRTRRYGFEHICILFDERLDFHRDGEKKNWTARCEPCMALSYARK